MLFIETNLESAPGLAHWPQADSGDRQTGTMIRYPKVYWGLGTLTYWYGSAIPRALPFSLAAGLLAALLEEFTSLGKHGGDAPDGKRVFLHPYPFQAFAFIAGFMIVFRCGPLYSSALASDTSA